MGRELRVYLFADEEHYLRHEGSGMPDDQLASVSGMLFVDLGLMNEWHGSIINLETIFYGEVEKAKRAPKHFLMLHVLASVIYEGQRDNCSYVVFNNT